MKNTSKRAFTIFLCGVLAFMACACGSPAPTQPDSGANATGGAAQTALPLPAEQTAEAEQKEQQGFVEGSGTETESAMKTAEERYARPRLISPVFLLLKKKDIAVAVTESGIAKDFSNVINYKDFYLPEGGDKRLLEDGFFVSDPAGGEFFEVYESNRYFQTPSFITVDSLMHSYHLYFSYILKKTEKGKLYERLLKLTDRMLDLSKKQHEAILSSADKETSSKWKEASDRNLAYFAVAKALLDTSYIPSKDKELDSEAASLAEEELKLINGASGISTSPLSGELNEMEDYTQYIPRGYYDTDEDLKRYFKTMMWYGRRNFVANSESMDRSALLMTCVMDDDAYVNWSSIYAITSFFAGESDDNGIAEYTSTAEEAYGAKIGELTADKLMDEEAFQKFFTLAKKLEAPAINSVPMWDDNGETDKAEANTGFRFMGQRFSIDASIFQKLVYSSVKENSKGEKRMLPDALDVPAALGSETAEKILKEDLKAMDFEGYEENLKELKDTISNAPEETWGSSLYSSWLNTLRPLLDEKGEGYPRFMQSENWKKRSLEGFLGSFTELKHDTVLYSKQMISEMGGGDEEIEDFRGYVEPEPLIYERFTNLANGTIEGLDKYSLLDSDAKRDLGRLSEIAAKLQVMSEKELKDELLTDEEYTFIEDYGGELEHFWHEVYKDEVSGEEAEYMTSMMFPAAVVVDVATDPNGSVLELGTANPATIYAVVSVEGKLRIAKGSVFNFYQFTQPIEERLTDKQWRAMLGIDPAEDGDYHWTGDLLPDRPKWTESYRAVTEY